jgi:uncharacterized protein (TIGR00369 family)
MSMDLDRLREQFDNSPFWGVLQMQVRDLKEGTATVETRLSNNFRNVNRAIHGGVILSLLDSAMGLTLRSVVDGPVVTQSLTSQFLRAPKNTDKIYASGEIVRMGSRVASMQARAFDVSERVLAIALATYMIPL